MLKEEIKKNEKAERIDHTECMKKKKGGEMMFEDEHEEKN